MLTEPDSNRSSEAESEDASLKNVSYYKAAVHLVIAIALTKIIGFLYVLYRGFGTEGWAMAVAPIVILFGLWIGSNFARYAGAIWLLVVFAGMAWFLFSYDGQVVFWPAAAWVALVGALSVAASWLLVLSRRFAAEFAYLRRTQPAYKTILRRVIFIVLVGTIAIATWNDIRPWIE